MISELSWFVLTATLILDGNRALDQGRPKEAIADFTQALRTPAGDLLCLRLNLATAYLTADDDRQAYTMLQQVQHSAPSGIARAELLNSWSAFHLKRSQFSAAETELREALQIVLQLPGPGDLLPSVLHNLASVEMRTGRYPDALAHEQEAIRRFAKVFAPDHPVLVRAWASLSSAQYMVGQPEAARLSIEQALASAQKTYGPAQPLIADLLESDAVILDKLKSKKAAGQARRRAREIRGGPATAAARQLTWNVKEVSPPGSVSLRSK